MPTKRQPQEKLHAEIRYADGTIETVDVENPSPQTIHSILHLGRLASTGPAKPALRRPAPLVDQHSGSRNPADQTLSRRRAPRWQSIRDWLLPLGEQSGFEHTTIELHEKFLGRQYSFTDPQDKPVAKTTGTNHRKARDDLVRRFGGEWIGEAIGPRNLSGTTRWRLVRP